MRFKVGDLVERRPKMTRMRKKFAELYLVICCRRRSQGFNLLPNADYYLILANFGTKTWVRCDRFDERVDLERSL